MSDIAAQEVFVDSGMLQRLLQPQHVIFLSFLIPDSLTVRVTNLLTDSLESLTDSLTSKLTLCSLDERVTGSLPNSLTYLLIIIMWWINEWMELRREGEAGMKRLTDFWMDGCSEISRLLVD